MAIFKNKHIEEGSFRFKKQKISFNGSLEVEDEDLIKYLSNEFWERLDKEESSEKEEVKEAPKKAPKSKKSK